MESGIVWDYMIFLAVRQMAELRIPELLSGTMAVSVPGPMILLE